MNIEDARRYVLSLNERMTEVVFADWRISCRIEKKWLLLMQLASLERYEGVTIVFSYQAKQGKKQSRTMRPLLTIVGGHRYQGKEKLITESAYRPVEATNLSAICQYLRGFVATQDMS